MWLIAPQDASVQFTQTLLIRFPVRARVALIAPIHLEDIAARPMTRPGGGIVADTGFRAALLASPSPAHFRSRN